jgi:allophanate hydrolase
MDKVTVEVEAAALGAFDPVAKPLWGVPFVIKDNIDAAGVPTTAACPDFAYVAEKDSFVVAALRAAGALLIGKTNLDQFATGLVGVRTPYPVPKNAIDPTIVPGGSSSGSAVAVSHGIVSFALGTDTAGSGRVPAALNNIVGLKPSLGALSNSGVVPACRSLDTISIFALCVEDAYRAFQSAAAYDECDSYARAVATPDLGVAPKSFVVGVPNQASLEFFGDATQAASYSTALQSITAMGGEVVEMDFQPFYDIAQMLYGGVWVAERFAAIEAMLKNTPESVHPTTRKVIEIATKFDAVDTFKSLYHLQDLKRSIAPALADVDFLCVPTVPTFATVDDLRADPIGPNSRLGTYTNFVNLLDMCGIAVPMEGRQDGRPGSITLLAPFGQDVDIAEIARALHQQSGALMGATGWAVPMSPSPPAEVREGEIAIAVVGAHMSGLPLNFELTRLGARFLRTDKTSGDYRLFSLPGGPPTRPGLIRVENGAAIDLEVWGLPLTAFGTFMAGIPQPLGIGTLTLANGSHVKGFVCEQCATKDAKDVTHFGGWRSFLSNNSKSSNKLMES